MRSEKMKKNLIIFGTIFLVGSLLIIIEVLGLFRYDHISPKFSIKDDQEIVYTDPYLESTIYLLSEDGQNLQSYYIRVKDPNSLKYGGWPLQQFTWAPDGNSLAFRSKSYSPSGIPVILTSSGEFIKCRGQNVPVGKARVWIIEGNRVVTPDQNGEFDTIVIFDLESCQIETVLYTAQNGDERLHEATLSSLGILAIGRYIENGQKKDILLIFPNGESVTISNGENPSWSKDGEHLAYIISGAGILTSNNRGEEETFISENENVSSETTPSWSSDGKKIIYDAGINIYLVDIDTESTNLLIENGISPCWRWD